MGVGEARGMVLWLRFVASKGSSTTPKRDVFVAEINQMMAGHSHLQALKKTTSKGLEFSSNKKIKMQEKLQDSKKNQKDSRTTRTQEHKELKNTKSSRTSRTQEHQKLKNNKFSRTTKD